MTRVTVVKPFLEFASRIDPAIVMHPDFRDLTITPSGTKVRNDSWEFPAQWLVRGPRSAHTISFEAVDQVFGADSSAALLSRQYAVLLLATNNSITSLPTFIKRAKMANRLIKACGNVTCGEGPLNAMSPAQCAEACASLYKSWAEVGSDRTLLKKVIEEISDFRRDNKVSDGFSNVDWSGHLCAMTQLTLTGTLDDLRKQPRKPVASKGNISTESLDPEWVKTFAPIAEMYIDELGPHILRHVDQIAEFQTKFRLEKAHCVKKVIGRTIADAYRTFALEEIAQGAWRTKDGGVFNALPFVTADDFAFPPRSLKDIFVLAASLQMACFQVLAITSAARLSEIHGVGPQGVCEQSSEIKLPAIRGLMFKNAGRIGFRPHKWVVSHLAIRALLLQYRLFERHRTGDHLWCQTAQGSFGAAMRSAECNHLQSFARRHLLGDTQISARRFRKTWAEFAMVSRLPLEAIRRQLGHAATESGINDMNIGYLLPSRESSFRFRAASAHGVRPSTEMLEILKEAMSS